VEEVVVEIQVAEEEQEDIELLVQFQFVEQQDIQLQ
jgi:hypothetical protein